MVKNEKITIFMFQVIEVSGGNGIHNCWHDNNMSSFGINVRNVRKGSKTIIVAQDVGLKPYSDIQY